MMERGPGTTNGAFHDRVTTGLSGAMDAIQLAWWEVDPAVLSLSGGSLQTVIAELPVVTFPSGDLWDTWGSFKRLSGWRILADQMHGRCRRLVLAAPHRAGPGLWVLAMLQENDQGELQLARVFEREQAWPGRAYRRRELNLEWVEDEFVVLRGTVPTLQVRLVNQSITPWIGRPGDIAPVIARLHDPSSLEPLPSTVHLAYAPGPRQSNTSPAIPAGGSLQLPVQLATHDVGLLEAGLYPISGLLRPLALEAKLSGHLRIRGV
jgi:hypothetical protein